MKIWNHIWMLLAFSTALGAITLLGISLASHHQIQRYYLESYPFPNSGGNELRIISDREWCIDGEIVLDRNITYEVAIDLVEKLNQKLDRLNKQK